MSSSGADDTSSSTCFGQITEAMTDSVKQPPMTAERGHDRDLVPVDDDHLHADEQRARAPGRS